MPPPTVRRAGVPRRGSGSGGGLCVEAGGDSAWHDTAPIVVYVGCMIPMLVANIQLAASAVRYHLPLLCIPCKHGPMPKAKGKKRPRFDGGHKSRRVTRHRSATLGGGRPEGLRLHHTPGDGNCLFRAFRDALRCEDEDSKEDDDCHTLRAHAVDYMRKNRDLFSAF
eukprot:Polyplicarium_translucidae@DN3280_c0_g2_i4.p1